MIDRTHDEIHEIARTCECFSEWPFLYDIFDCQLNELQDSTSSCKYYQRDGTVAWVCKEISLPIVHMI